MFRPSLVPMSIVLGSASCAAVLGMAASALAQETATEATCSEAPLESLAPDNLALSADTERKAPGALILVSLDSNVGVVLDEIPVGKRAAAASYYLAKSSQFWKDRAIAQAQNTSYRLTYRNFFYSGNKGMMAMPPKELWNIQLKPG